MQLFRNLFVAALCTFGLAAQALHLLDTLGVRSLEVDDSLRRALALLPRRLGSFEIGADDTLASELEEDLHDDLAAGLGGSAAQLEARIAAFDYPAALEILTKAMDFDERLRPRGPART